MIFPIYSFLPRIACMALLYPTWYTLSDTDLTQSTAFNIYFAPARLNFDSQHVQVQRLIPNMGFCVIFEGYGRCGWYIDVN